MSKTALTLWSSNRSVSANGWDRPGSIVGYLRTNLPDATQRKSLSPALGFEAALSGRNADDVSKTLRALCLDTDET